MIRIDFKHAPIFAALARARSTLDDLTPAYEEIGEYMVEATQQRFRDGKGPDASVWAPKKPATIARYKSKGDGDRPDPLIGPSKRLSTEIQGLATKDSVEIGSALEYSGVMQGGAAKGAFGQDSRGRDLPYGTIPARVWLGISATDQGNIVDIIDEHIGAAIEN